MCFREHETAHIKRIPMFSLRTILNIVLEVKMQFWRESRPAFHSQLTFLPLNPGTFIHLAGTIDNIILLSSLIFIIFLEVSSHQNQYYV